MKKTLAVTGAMIAMALFWIYFQTGVVLAKSRFQEESHQSFALTTNGAVRVDNVNGRIHISAWDKAEVTVDGRKHADREADLDEVKIEIDSKADQIRIHTRYPSTKWSLWRKSNSASVDYEIKVPASARLENVETVNGSVEIEDVRGAVHASTVNGALVAKGLAADAELESVNGKLDVTFARLEGVKAVSLKTVNGGVDARLPAKADAEVSANTVNGGIRSDSDLTVNKHWPVGSELHGKLGQGGARIKAETVNGGIRISQIKSGAKQARASESQSAKARLEDE